MKSSFADLVASFFNLQLQLTIVLQQIVAFDGRLSIMKDIQINIDNKLNQLLQMFTSDLNAALSLRDVPALDDEGPLKTCREVKNYGQWSFKTPAITFQRALEKERIMIPEAELQRYQLQWVEMPHNINLPSLYHLRYIAS